MTALYNIVTVDPEMSLNGHYLALRQKCEPVEPLSDETKAIVDILFNCLENGPFVGVGLAAPQLGILARIFVVNIPELRKKTYSDDKVLEDPQEEVFPDPTPMRLAVINPEFIYLSEEKEKDYESCLSIPHFRGPVLRHKALQVVAYNVEGNKIDLKLHGFVARVFQHEYDHLDGVLFTSRMQPGDELEHYQMKMRTPPAESPKSL